MPTPPTIWEHAAMLRPLAARLPQVLLLAGGRCRHRLLPGRAGGPRPGDQAPAPGRLVPLPGMHLLQRVVHPLVAPDRLRHHPRQDLARLHRDAAGGRRPPGRSGAARDDEEAQGRVPDAGRGVGSHRGRRRLLLHRRPHRPRHRAARRPRAPRRSSPGAAAPRMAASRPPSPIRPAPRPIHKLITGKPIIKVPGCPPIGEVMAGTIVHLLAFDTIPAAGSHRPAEGVLLAPRARHLLPPPNYDAGLFVESWDDENARKGYCLYKMGCRGPVDLQRLRRHALEQRRQLPDPVAATAASAAAKRTSGTTARSTSHLANFPGFGIETTADKVGVAAGVGHRRRHRRRTPCAHERPQAASVITDRRRRRSRRNAVGGTPWPTASSSTRSRASKGTCASRWR